MNTPKVTPLSNASAHTINTLKGLACILLVSYHVVGNDANHGLAMEAGFYRQFNDALVYLRMPLFTFLSGVLYAYRPLKTDYWGFALKKCRRLLLPLLSVGTVFAVLQVLMSRNDPSFVWYLTHIIPVGHFWFLEALMGIFMLVMLLERWSIMSTKQEYLLVLLGTITLSLLPLGSQYFSFSGFLYITPYFFLGLGVGRFRWLPKIKRNGIHSVLGKTCLILLTGIFSLLYFDVLPRVNLRSTFGIILSGLSCLLIYQLNFRSQWLEKIGGYSYSIYLFHVFFTAGIRLVLNQSNIENLHIQYFSSLSMGILGPIITHWLLDRYSLTRFLCLGRAMHPKHASPTSESARA